MGITKANVTIMVKSMDESVRFYQAIGLSLDQRWGNHYAQIKAPGLVIGLHPYESPQANLHTGNISIGFVSDDFEETKNLLTSLNINFNKRTEEGGTFLHFTDPDGTPLYFIKPKW